MALNADDTLLNGHYRIIRQLGRGGFGFVYLAQDMLLSEQVAIKELIPALVGDEDTLKRFLAEARATMRLTHERIVRTHNVFREGGNYYIVMECMAGDSLETRLRERASLPVDEAVQVAAEVCEGLAYAHERGVVHCDLKPANILFDARGHAKVADFGIAHVSGEMLTRTWKTPQGFVAGTLPYMSPEQADGVRDDPRIDVYAVGAVLYRILTEQTYLEFDQRETPGAQADNVYRIRNQEAEPPSVHAPGLPAWLDNVVLKALAKQPEERYTSAEHLHAALLQRRPAAAPPPQPAPAPSSRSVRVLPAAFWPLVLSSGALLVAIVIGLVALLGGNGTQKAMPPATLAVVAQISNTATPTATQSPFDTPTNTPRPPTKTALPMTGPSPTDTPTDTPRPPTETTSPMVSPSPTDTPTYTPWPPTETAWPTASPPLIPPEPASSVAVYTPTPTGVAVSSGPASIGLGNASEIKLLRILDETILASSVAFSPEGAMLAAGWRSGFDHVRILRTSDWVILHTFWQEGHTHVRTVALSPGGKFMASGGGYSDNTVQLWHVPDETLLQALPQWNSVRSVVFSPDGELVASAGDDGQIRIRRVPDAKPVQQLSVPDVVFSIAFSPDGSKLASGALDGFVRVWRVSDGTLLQQVQADADGVYAVSFSPSGKSLATTRGHDAIVLDAQTGAIMQTMTGHQREVLSLAFNLDGTVLATGSADGTLRLWRVSDGEVLIVLEDTMQQVTSVAFSPKGALLATGSRDGRLRLWGITPP